MQAIQNVLDNFNFNAVHEHMTSVKWGWGCDNLTPTVQELRAEAQRLLSGVALDPRENTSHSCGGFHAHKWTWNDGSVELELIFALEVWHA